MTTLERRLTEALAAGAAQVSPAPDLFSRVADSIAADRRRRRLLVRGVGVIIAAVAALISLGLGMSTYSNGRLVMPWWALEVISTIVLIAMALWLGPFIKRFGRAYAADVFKANPLTGKSYIVLTDIVYYLIFTAYILFTSRFEPDTGWRATVTASQAQASVFRVAGILLIIGVLHGLNIVLMPVLGRLFSLNRRLDSLNRTDGVEE
jgi:threonine/homoserine/homoserine lactone efflux protein